MLDSETADNDNDTVLEQMASFGQRDVREVSASLDVRRRIERMRELKRLRELLDDPEFDDLL